MPAHLQAISPVLFAMTLYEHLPLFAHALARRGDHDSSHAAAAQALRSGLAAGHEAIIVRALRESGCALRLAARQGSVSAPEVFREMRAQGWGDELDGVDPRYGRDLRSLGWAVGEDGGDGSHGVSREAGSALAAATVKLDTPLPNAVILELREIAEELADALKYDGFCNVADDETADERRRAMLAGERDEAGYLSEIAVTSAHDRLSAVLLASDAAALRAPQTKGSA